MTSCIDSIKQQFGVLSDKEAVVIMPTSTGYPQEIGDSTTKRIAIIFKHEVIKSIKIKYNLSTNVSSISTTTFNCASALALKKLVIWVFDPTQKTMEFMNQLFLMMISLQLLDALMGMIV